MLNFLVYSRFYNDTSVMFFKPNTIFLLFLMAGLHFFAPGLFAQEPSAWALQRNEKGLKIYTRTIPGSPLKEVKALMQVNSSLSSVVGVIRDFDSYKLWVYKCLEAKLLKNTGDSDFYYYHVTDSPWPMEDRDAISRVLITQNKKTLELRIYSNGIPDYLPEKAGYFRLPKSSTLWVLTPVGPNLIEVEYVLGFDPGGDAPSWLVNMFITDGPFESLLLLKQRVQDPKYAKAHFPFVKEK